MVNRPLSHSDKCLKKLQSALNRFCLLGRGVLAGAHGHKRAFTRISPALVLRQPPLCDVPSPGDWSECVMAAYAPSRCQRTPRRVTQPARASANPGSLADALEDTRYRPVAACSEEGIRLPDRRAQATFQFPAQQRARAMESRLDRLFRQLQTFGGLTGAQPLDLRRTNTER